MRISTMVATLMVAGIPVLNAQEKPIKPAIFSSELEMVNVVLTVTTEKNRPVAGLTLQDILLSDSSRKQEIAVFIEQMPPTKITLMIDISLSMGEVPQSTSDRRDPRPLDDDVKRAAKQLVKAMRPEDQMLLVPFAERPSPEGDFSNDKELLQREIDALQATGNTSLHQSLYEVLKTRIPKQQPDTPHRSVIVLITDGEDTTSLINQERVVDEVKRGQVAIYTIELPHNGVGPDARGRAMEAHDFLAGIARESGGINQVVSSTLASISACTRIMGDLGAQYWLGYQPDISADGKWHEVKVQILGKPNFKVRHRSGYYATKKR